MRGGVTRMIKGVKEVKKRITNPWGNSFSTSPSYYVYFIIYKILLTECQNVNIKKILIQIFFNIFKHL